MSSKPSLTLVAEPAAYFHELVTSTLTQRQIKTRPETEFYLVNLLKQFLFTENLYARDAQGSMRDEPLSLLLKEALDTPEAQAQRLMLRQVGDVSLYVAGFFQESLTRKAVDLGYYIDMGGIAYRRVSITETEPSRSMYGELADRFGTFVNVLTEIREGTQRARTEKDLLRLYELWLQTGSEWAAKALREAGIEPTRACPTPRQ